ncbi:hypothetical protein ACIPUC_03100 [Streptomyces sp. LARHCF249]
MTTKTTGRVVVAVLLCAVLAACGSTGAGQAAGPAPVPSLTPQKCALDVPTEEQTGGYAGPPTDQETGGYAGPPTDQETGAYAGPPTDQETGGYAGPPTDQETGGYAGPPTDGEMGNGGGPCGPADWFDMTRDFSAYYAKRRTSADHFMPADTIREVRVRKVREVGEAKISFVTGSVGKGRAEDARRLAGMFTRWRHEVYGDKGTVQIRTADGDLVVTENW